MDNKEQMTVVRVLLYKGTRNWVQNTLDQSHMPTNGVRQFPSGGLIKSNLMDVDLQHYSDQADKATINDRLNILESYIDDIEEFADMGEEYLDDDLADDITTSTQQLRDIIEAMKTDFC